MNTADLVSRLKDKQEIAKGDYEHFLRMARDAKRMQDALSLALMVINGILAKERPVYVEPVYSIVTVGAGLDEAFLICRDIDNGTNVEYFADDDEWSQDKDAALPYRFKSAAEKQLKVIKQIAQEY